MEVSLEIGAFVTALIAGAAAITGLHQYKKAEAWKRAEFTGRQFEQLSKNEELAFACKSLDWGIGPLIVPTKYRTLYPDGQATINHDWNKLANALRQSININVVTDTDQLVYRYCFDALFDYFDRLRVFVLLDLVELEDLNSLAYYAALVEEPAYYSGSLSKREVFGGFIDVFYPNL